MVTAIKYNGIEGIQSLCGLSIFFNSFDRKKMVS